MMANFLEQLVAEWYEIQGYFVRRNVKVGRRPKGGWDGELDVVAFHPRKKHLIHIEPSTDALPWGQRQKRFEKKFDAGRKYIPALFEGLNVPPEIEQIALLGIGSSKTHSSLGGGRVMTSPVPGTEQILTAYQPTRACSDAVSPEIEASCLRYGRQTSRAGKPAMTLRCNRSAAGPGT